VERSTIRNDRQLISELRGNNLPDGVLPVILPIIGSYHRYQLSKAIICVINWSLVMHVSWTFRVIFQFVLCKLWEHNAVPFPYALPGNCKEYITPSEANSCSADEAVSQLLQNLKLQCSSQEVTTSPQSVLSQRTGRVYLRVCMTCQMVSCLHVIRTAFYIKSYHQPHWVLHFVLCEKTGGNWKILTFFILHNSLNTTP
jgi:hypothetical protein